MLGANTALVFGFVFTRVFASPSIPHLDPSLFIFKLGAVLTILLLLPNLYVFTGKGLGDIPSAISDQGAAWNEMQTQIATRSPATGAFVLLRAILAPLTLAAVPLLVFYWRYLSRFWRLVGLMALVSVFAFSFARGTDKETVELGIFFMLGLLIYLLRRPGGFLVQSFRLTLVGMFLVVILVAVVTLFAARKDARLGGIETYCQSVTKICADYDHPLLAPLDASTKGAASIAVNYLTQGQYGLSLALAEEFDSLYGIGHSSVFMAQYSRWSSDSSFLERSYTYKIDARGWPRTSAWSSAYTWLANDIGFFGIILLMLVWGMLLALAWTDFVYAGNPLAFLVVVLFALTLFYMPMNLQLTQSLDYYIPTIVWTLFWFITRRKNAVQ
ncbi:MAG: hypothetical protein AAFN43_08385 [Pseudomonadota bacterium]